jgi:predicted CopG family antitoxin
MLKYSRCYKHDMFGSNKQYKQILIDVENYDALKEMGQTGDSFNKVISKLINKFKGDKQ